MAKFIKIKAADIDIVGHQGDYLIGSDQISFVKTGTAANTNQNNAYIKLTDGDITLGTPNTAAAKWVAAIQSAVSANPGGVLATVQPVDLAANQKINSIALT